MLSFGTYPGAYHPAAYGQYNPVPSLPTSTAVSYVSQPNYFQQGGQLASEPAKPVQDVVGYVKPDGELTMQEHRDNLKAAEESVFAAHHEMELLHYEINKNKSEDYTTLYHKADQKATEYRLRFEAVKNKLSTNEIPEEKRKEIFGTTGMIPNLKPHPFDELKALRDRIHILRNELETKVTAELKKK